MDNSYENLVSNSKYLLNNEERPKGNNEINFSAEKMSQIAQFVSSISVKKDSTQKIISQILEGKPQVESGMEFGSENLHDNGFRFSELESKNQSSVKVPDFIEQELTFYKKKLTEKQGIILELKYVLNDLQQDSVLHNAVITGLRNKVADQTKLIIQTDFTENQIARQNNLLKSELARFAEIAKELQSSVEFVKTENANREEENVLLLTQKDRINQELKSYKEAEAKLIQEIDFLKAEILTASLEKESLNSEINNLKIDVSRETQINSELRDQLSYLEQLAAQNHLNDNNNASSADSENYTQLVQQLETLQKENDHLAAVRQVNQALIIDLNATTSNLQSQIQNINENSNLTEQENKRLKNEVKYLNQAVNWYKKTYEARRLRGIIKDKLSKKININGPVNELFQNLYKIKKAKAQTNLSDKILCAVVNYNCNDNALLLQKNLSRHFDTVIFDSGSEKKSLKFIKLGNVYYSGLLNNAYKYAKEKGYEYLFFICSDVEVSNEAADKMVANLSNLNLNEIGLYSPASKGRSHIFCKKVYEEGLRTVPFAEGFIFLCAMDVLDQFLPIDLNINLFGWGLDVTKGYFARKLGKLCVIDDGVEVYHPESTGYSNDKAEADMWHWLDSFDDPGFRNFFEKHIGILRQGMADKLKITVIIPCYNQEPYLKETIYSLLLQEYTTLEILIIDDGSTDNSAEIAREFSARFPFIKYLHKANGGLGNTRNFGLQHATGDFIQFLDGDDTLSPDKLLNQIYTIINNASIEVSYTPYLCFEDGKPENTWTYSRVILNEDPAMDLIMNWEKDLSIPVHCFLFKQEVLRDLRFDEELPNHEDWLFHLTVAAVKPKYHFENSGLAYYRVRMNSMARDKELMVKGKRMCIDKAIQSNRFTTDYILELNNRILEN